MFVLYSFVCSQQHIHFKGIYMLFKQQYVCSFQCSFVCSYLTIFEDGILNLEHKKKEQHCGWLLLWVFQTKGKYIDSLITTNIILNFF